MPEIPAYLFDTSAMLALLEKEPGAERVRELIASAIRGESALHACFVSLTEVRYLVIYRRGPETAAQTIAELKALPIHWLHSDEPLCAEAAEWKANHKLSFADAFVVASSLRLSATLVHKDPEYMALPANVRQEVLPLKTAASPTEETAPPPGG